MPFFRSFPGNMRYIITKVIEKKNKKNQQPPKTKYLKYVDWKRTAQGTFIIFKMEVSFRILSSVHGVIAIDLSNISSVSMEDFPSLTQSFTFTVCSDFKPF